MQQILDQLKQDTNRSSTKKVYYNVWKNFNKFLVRLDSIPKLWEDRVSLYCTYLIVEKNVQSQTIKTYVSAIKRVLTNDSYEWNDQLILLSALTRSCKLKNDCIKTRLPIQKQLLELLLLETEKLLSKSGEQPYLVALYQTAFLFAYYGMLRVGEVALGDHTIKAKNVHINKKKNKILIVLHSSKTHGRESRPQKIRIMGSKHVVVQDETGNTVKCSYSKDTKLTKFLCPVETAIKFAELRPSLDIDNEQFFVFRDRTPLRPHHLRDVLRATLDEMNLNASLYDTHSFRIGCATDLFRANYHIDSIKILGRWKSNAVYKYLRFP